MYNILQIRQLKGNANVSPGTIVFLEGFIYLSLCVAKSKQTQIKPEGADRVETFYSNNGAVTVLTTVSDRRLSI